jgi:RNA recognition motif. (a.k.a. RRM, RBD, or RNP domain)
VQLAIFMGPAVRSQQHGIGYLFVGRGVGAHGCKVCLSVYHVRLPARLPCLRRAGLPVRLLRRRCEAKLALPRGGGNPSRTTRIFIARIPPSVSDQQFRSYFEQFGAVQDAYMPKDVSKVSHRGIGFVTFAASDSVEQARRSAPVSVGLSVLLPSEASRPPSVRQWPAPPGFCPCVCPSTLYAAARLRPPALCTRKSDRD